MYQHILILVNIRCDQQTLHAETYVHLCNRSSVVEADCVLCEVQTEAQETMGNLNVSQFV
jgi:hypothetical protein